MLSCYLGDVFVQKMEIEKQCPGEKELVGRDSRTFRYVIQEGFVDNVEELANEMHIRCVMS